ncbi:MAG: putative tellurium resistance membrane protein TerC [Bacteroidia bacterium]|jgi:predicted tellurium resistance membrane protein TerC
MEHLLTTEALISLLTLTALETILGIDNIIFISLVTDKLPQKQESKGRIIGLVVAMVVRVLLLMGITTIIKWGEAELFTVFGKGFSFRNLILLAGGLFLIAKSTKEIHNKVEEDGFEDVEAKSITMFKAITQIVLIDIVFSFDSILTAVGLVEDVEIMIVAVIISMSMMIVFAKTISDFIEQNPTFKVLALSFLILVGFLLVLEGFGQHVEKGYVYFAIAFAFIVEIINNRIRKKNHKKGLSVKEIKESYDDV